VLAVLNVRFRDVGQVWELLSQLLFFAIPIMYPLGLLPQWARTVSLLNPITQVIQDIRIVLIPTAPHGSILTSRGELGDFGHLYSLAIAATLLACAILLYRRDEPWLAERA
jgi:ABC-2 type transport system permease protein